MKGRGARQGRGCWPSLLGAGASSKLGREAGWAAAQSPVGAGLCRKLARVGSWAVWMLGIYQG